ncbi:hypothetical protein BBP40_006153 [Aspergillus hancockii]|nr:hypothetical protein BBP40_006153 [Aspergillus hancockii]
MTSQTEGTILITGANGSLALEFVDQLLACYSNVTLVGTVRNTSNEDPNTAKLNQIVSKYPGRNVYIEKLDLKSFENVRQFSNRIADKVTKGTLPRISTIVCNAFAWSLTGGVKYSSDGFESSFQVTYLSHFLLVLTLLGSMDAEKGRIVMLGSSTHYPDRPNPLSKLTACFPDDIEELVHVPAYPPEENHDRGFQRYGTAKLMIVFFMNDLNRRLQKDPTLNKIAVITMDPGGLTNSRAHGEQRLLGRVMFSVLNALMPVLKYLTSDIRTTSQSAADLVTVAAGPDFQNVRGYYDGLRPTEPSRVTEDVQKQDLLWKASWKWSGLTERETALYEKL